MEAKITNLMRQSSLGSLMPLFFDRLDSGLIYAREAGLSVNVFETIRTPERQTLLYAQGRSAPGKIITNAEPWESWHQYGVAVDLAFDRNPQTLKVEWTWDGPWAKLAQIMKKEGLEWLGDPGHSFIEFPHFQLTGGLDIKVAHKLYVQGGLQLVWDTIENLCQENPNENVS